MLKKILITSVLAASACAVMNANAALPVGLYVSGQAGYADTHMKSRLSSNKGIALANDGLAGRIALGYKITPNFGLEVGYLQLSEGKSNQPQAVTLYNKQHAIDVAAKGILPITNNVNIYGKLGVAYLTTELKKDSTTNGIPTSTDLNYAQGIAKHKWAPEVTVGMGYDITPNVTVDTSLTHIQPMGSNRSGNIDFLAVGIDYNFG